MIRILYSASLRAKNRMEKLLTVFPSPCNWVTLLLFRESKCMHGTPNCSLGLFYLLEGMNLARNILEQTPSTLILLAFCSICLFLCFQYSFHPSPASFSNSAVLTLSCSAFCCGTNTHPRYLYTSQWLKEAVVLQLHPLPEAIQTTKAGFVWGEIEAKGEGLLGVPFPGFSFCQISTNLVWILDAFLPFFTLPLPHTPPSLPPGCRNIR